MRTIPRLVLAMLTLLFTSVAVVGLSAPANATDYYRYWTYFQVKGDTYVASQKGVGAFVPKDGSIDAYRYAAPQDYKEPNLPRVDLTEVTFDAVCGDTEAADGNKRVAVIIDYGVEADAEGQEVPEPTAACASVPTTATGLQVLDAVADVRSKSSSMGPLLCGIDGYPAKGCADQVTTTATPADRGFVDLALSSDDAGDPTSGDTGDGDGNTGLYVGLGALVAALIAVGLVVARRNRSA